MGGDMGEDTQTKEKTAGKGLYPVLPLRDVVVFPYMIVPLFAHRSTLIIAVMEIRCPLLALSGH